VPALSYFKSARRPLNQADIDIIKEGLTEAGLSD